MGALGLACATGSPDSVLLLDRGLPADAVRARRVAWKGAGGAYLADSFQIGGRGEVWVIDKVRVWGVPGAAASEARTAGDLYERITLYGGLESESQPATSEAAAAVCACHGPVKIASAELGAGGVAEGAQFHLQAVTYPDGSSFQEGAAPLAIWQVDFQNLRWSVPGGQNVLFGVYADGRAAAERKEKPVWFNHAETGGGRRRFLAFQTAGNPVVPAAGELPDEESLAINVQVWGHLTAGVAIRPAANQWQVALLGSATLDISQVDPGSVRFGPRSAAPLSHEEGDSNGDGAPDLLFRFDGPESGIPPSGRTACLWGVRRDGVPFEGCDTTRKAN